MTTAQPVDVEKASMTPDFLDSIGTQQVVDDANADQQDQVSDEIEDDPEDEGTAGGEGEQVEQEPKAAATTVVDESKEAAGIKAGLIAERKKRQELEKRIKELQDAESARQQQAPKVKFYEDPERYVQERLQESEAKRYAALEEDMREQHEDYDDMTARVIEASQRDSTIKDRVLGAANPARAMYKLGKELAEAEKLKDPEAYKASIRDELKAELLAELRKDLTPDAGKPKPNLPRDLSNGRSGTETVATTRPVDPRKGEFADMFTPR